jgi:hypothetical protein
LCAHPPAAPSRAAALTGTGLDSGEVLDVAVTLVGHVRMPTEQGRPWSAIPLSRIFWPSCAAAETGSQPCQRLSIPLPRMAHRARLDFGLSRILDGVELLIAARA